MGIDQGQLGEITKARSSFEYFAKNDTFIDQEEFGGEFLVKDFHQRWVDAAETNERLAITAFTGSGKTSVLGVVYPLWKILQDPGFDVLIVAPAMEQSKKILKHIKHHLKESPYFSNLVDEEEETWNQTEAHLTNGSRIFCKPFNENVKSVHVDFVLVDEAAEGDLEVYERFVKTRVARKNGTACLISTPVSEQDLMSKLSDGVEVGRCQECMYQVEKESSGEFICPNSECSRFEEVVEPVVDENVSERGYWNDKFPVEDSNGEPTFPEAFSREDINQLRLENPEAFQREYLCEALAVEGDLFDPNSIIDCYDKDEAFRQTRDDDCKYYLGADFAVSKQGDYSVFTVLEQSPEREEVVLRHMERLSGMQLPEQSSRIKELHRIFDFRRIVVDETNFGRTVLQSLKEDGLPVRGQSFERKARNNLIINLKTMIENGEIVIPRGSQGTTETLTDKLFDELLGFGTSVTDAGSISYQSTAEHDDTVMSLGMAANAVEDSREIETTIAFR